LTLPEGTPGQAPSRSLARGKPEGPFTEGAGAGRRARGLGENDLRRCRAPGPGSVRGAERRTTVGRRSLGGNAAACAPPGAAPATDRALRGKLIPGSRSRGVGGPVAAGTSKLFEWKG